MPDTISSESSCKDFVMSYKYFDAILWNGKYCLTDTSSTIRCRIDNTVLVLRQVENSGSTSN